MTKHRRRFKQTVSCKDRHKLWAENIRGDAVKLRPGRSGTRFSRKQVRPTPLPTLTNGLIHRDCSRRCNGQPSSAPGSLLLPARASGVVRSMPQCRLLPLVPGYEPQAFSRT